MESSEETDGTHVHDVDEDKETSSGSNSLSGSLGSSQSVAEFRRQMRPPNKKKYEGEMEEITQQIKTKDGEMKSLGSCSPENLATQMREVRAEKEASINKRKKIDHDLKLLNQEITKKMGLLTRTESNLHYKNEAKIDDAIRKMEYQLQTQNFRVSEERKIVAEVDKLKRSKKVLVEYFAQKRELDKMRESQRRMRGERDQYYRAVTTLNKKEEDLKKLNQSRKAKTEEIKKELDQLYERKRQLFAEFKHNETEYVRQKSKLRKESFKKREEEKRMREDARQKEILEYQSMCEPFEDEKNLCNTLVSYLQRFAVDKEDPMLLPSPREEQPGTPFGSGSSLGPADSLDDGKYVLLKKSEEAEADYSVSNKPRRRSKKDRRKLSVTKPLAHTPQIIAQFSSLNLNAPSNMSEVQASIEQLQARKLYYEQQTMHAPRPMLGSFSGSLGSSGSFSGSLESPLRERASTWSFVEVPPAIAENQAPSTSGESGFHDMSRQASKTESSESTAECSGSCDQILEEMIKQSAEYGESETSRSSSDTTITPEEQLVEEADSKGTVADVSSISTNQGTSNAGSDNPASSKSSQTLLNVTNEPSVFDEPSKQGGDHQTIFKEGHLSKVRVKIVNYDMDFPEMSSSSCSNPGSKSDNKNCDRTETRQTTESSDNGTKDSLKNSDSAVLNRCDSGLPKGASDSVRDVICMDKLGEMSENVINSTGDLKSSLTGESKNVTKTEVLSDVLSEMIKDVHIRGVEVSKGQEEIAECIDEAVVVEDIGDSHCDEITHL